MEKNSGTFEISNRDKGLKVYFKLITILSPFILLILFELLLRLFSAGYETDLFIRVPGKDFSRYMVTNPSVGEKYFTKFDATTPKKDVFLKNKPDNGYRIFVLGSSTMVGFPYGNNLMSSRILQRRLQDAYPDKQVEVINTAITAINSITLNDYMNDIVRYDPDAILIYAGHNEYYGAFGIGSNEALGGSEFVRNIHFSLMHLRIYQLLRKGYHAISAGVSGKEEEKGSLMSRIVADEEIVLGSREYYYGLHQFRTNIEDILQKASRKDISVFLCDLVSNVKDQPPFSYLTTGEENEAHRAYSEAWRQLALGDSSAAFDAFYAAKDLDPIRFRASEDLNHIIDSLSEEYHCFKVPVKSVFINASENGLIGNNLLTEHVHPNIHGQFLMAEAFFNSIAGSGVIGDISQQYLYSPAYYKRNWPYTELDSLIGEYRVRQLKSYWPFSPLGDKQTFRDTHVVRSGLDSLAFSALLTNESVLEKIHGELAESYLAKGDFPKALEEYETLAELSPMWYPYHNHAATCLLKLDDLNNAEKHLTASIKYKPTFIAHILLGDIELIKHYFDEAAYNYEQALSHAENKEQENTALTKLYSSYYYMGETKQLSLITAKLDKRNISYPVSLPTLKYDYSGYIPFDIKEKVLQAKECMSRSEIDSALYFLGLCLHINDSPLVNRLIGDCLYLKKSLTLLRYYSKAFEAFGREPEFLKMYIIALYLNQDFPRANEVLTLLEEIDPDYSELGPLRKMLNAK